MLVPERAGGDVDGTWAVVLGFLAGVNHQAGARPFSIKDDNRRTAADRGRVGNQDLTANRMGVYA